MGNMVGKKGAMTELQGVSGRVGNSNGIAPQVRVLIKEPTV